MTPRRLIAFPLSASLFPLAEMPETFLPVRLAAIEATAGQVEDSSLPDFAGPAAEQGSIVGAKRSMLGSASAEEPQVKLIQQMKQLVVLA